MSRKLLSLIALAATAASTPVVRAQTFVYDTRAMAINGTCDNYGPSFIGGLASPIGTGYVDCQAADDFVLAAPTRLTRVVVDFIQEFASNPPPEGGFLIEIFPNTASNTPAEVPTYSATVTASPTIGSFTSPGAPPLPASAASGGHNTYTLDLGSGTVLAAGTWWLSVVPTDITPFGCYYFWAGTSANSSGFVACRRAGGADHGNGYHGYGTPLVSPTNWAANPGLPSAARTLSMRIEGDVAQGACCAASACSLVANASACGGGTYQGDGTTCAPDSCSAPASGACCSGTTCAVVAGSAGCAAGSFYQGDNSICGGAGNPTTCCPANYNGVNGLSVQDIFDYLAGWFAGDAAADFNHSGAITVQDIFDFLAAWFAGC